MDADTAGGNPAPNQTQTAGSAGTASTQQGTGGSQTGPQTGLTRQSILADTLSALAGPIDSPQTAAATMASAQNATLASAQNATLPQPAAVPTPANAPTAGNATAASTPTSNVTVSTEALVASSTLDAAGTGGGTLLGRTLTRAANAAADLGSNPVAAATAESASAVNAVASASSNQTSAEGNGGETATPAQAGAAAATAQASSAAASTATVAAFLQSFEKALASTAQASDADAPDQTQTDGTAAAATPVASPGTAGQSFLASIGALQTAQVQTTTTQAAPPQTTGGTAPQTTDGTDPNAVVSQLLRGINMRDLGSSSEIRLRLVPESLGDVSVKLTVDNAGSVTASILAHTTEAHDALVAGQGQLTRSLSDAGLKLTSFNVDLSNSGGNAFGQQQSQPQQQPRGGYGAGPVVSTTDSSEDPLLAAVPSFAPPATAATPGASALNYLA